MSFFNEINKNPEFSKKSSDKVILIDTESNDLQVSERSNIRKKVGAVSHGDFSLSRDERKKLTNKKEKKRDSKSSNKPSFDFRRYFNYYGVLAAVVFTMLVRVLFMDGGVSDLFGAVETKDYLQNKRVELSLENEILNKEIAKLETNKSYLKRVVREQLGVIAPDEYILIFPES